MKNNKDKGQRGFLVSNEIIKMSVSTAPSVTYEAALKFPEIHFIQLQGIISKIWTRCWCVTYESFYSLGGLDLILRNQCIATYCLCV